MALTKSSGKTTAIDKLKKKTTTSPSQGVGDSVKKGLTRLGQSIVASNPAVALSNPQSKTSPAISGGAKTTGTQTPAFSQPQRQQEGIKQGLTGTELQRYVETGAYSPAQSTTPTTSTPSYSSTPKQPSTHQQTSPVSASQSAPPQTFDYSQVYQPQTGVSDARTAYLASLQPSAEETALQTQLADLRESAGLGISGLEGQGRGIPLALVRGQQAQLQEQAAIKEQGLVDRLNALQNARTAEQQARLTEMNLAQQDQALALQQQQFQAQQMKPFEFGGNLVRLNPQTGQLETVAEGATGALEPIKLSAGEVLYDPNTGQPIYQAPGGSGAALKSYTPGDMIYDPTTGTFSQVPGQQYMSPTDVQKVNKEIVSSDAYKALTTVNDVQSSVDNFRELVNTLGQRELGFGKSSQQLDTAYNRLMLQLKEFFNLGVLNGPDLELMQQVVPPPTGFGNITRGGKNAVLAGLDEVQNMIDSHVQGRKQDLQTQYSQFDPRQVTALQNVGIGSTGGLSPQDDPLGLGFSGVGGDTNKATIQSPQFTQAIKQTYPIGADAGQCGRFVNNLTGIGMGNEFEQKMSLTDPSIGSSQNPPLPGDVFVMPYSWTGHTGIIESVVPKADGTFDLNVVDSNWKLDEKIRHHTINSAKVSGYARAPIKLA